MTSQGSAYARFRRALETGNLTLIRSAAAELPRVNLGDALAVCVAIRRAEPDRFERAAPLVEELALVTEIGLTLTST